MNNINKNMIRKKSGSILLEALLAIVILSTSIAVIINAMTSSMRSTVYSTDYTKAVLLIENELFDVISKGSIGNDINKEVDLDDEKTLFTYTARTEEYDDVFMTDEGSKLIIVSADMEWKSGRKHNNIKFDVLLLAEDEQEIDR